MNFYEITRAAGFADLELAPAMFQDILSGAKAEFDVR